MRACGKCRALATPWRGWSWSERLNGSLDLGNGYNAATVWVGGAWQTWDRVGLPRERGVAVGVAAAMVDAEEAVRRQGFFTLDAANKDESLESLDHCTNCRARTLWAETPRADLKAHREAHAAWRRGRRVA